MIKKIFLFLGCMLIVSLFAANAQDADNNHFIYIQAKAKQPFYVILNKKVYSSSSIGYLIIPKLKDGKYDLRIGFPKEQTPEQNFTCVVKNEDAGYSLEKGEDGNLGLLNLQTKNFIAANSVTTVEDQYAVASVNKGKENEADVIKDTVQRSSAFSEMLSNVANDPTLNKPVEQPRAALQEKEEKLSAQVADFGKDAEADSKAVADSYAENLNPADVVSDVSKTYGVIKSAQQQTGAGTEMTFVMFNSRSTDTIKVVVPKLAQAVVASGEDTSTVPAERISKKESLALFSNTEEDNYNVENNGVQTREARRERRKEKRFVDIAANQGAVLNEGAKVDNPFYDKTKTDAANTDKEENAVAIAAQADQDETVDKTPACDNPISEKDFNKMQKKMIARNNDNDMIAIVDKYIKGKCITTAQVKQLGGLFLSDAGRYALFHDAYSNVSDKENFPALENQLLDSYFKKRFETLLK